YAGLTLLADFTPDFIKLDMALIRDIHLSRSRQAIVKGMLHTCRDMGVTVIAEGIESARERDFLYEAGVRLMQGYLFGKPAFQAAGFVNEAAWTLSSQRFCPDRHGDAAASTCAANADRLLTVPHRW